jgi:hypothetical protein
LLNCGFPLLQLHGRFLVVLRDHRPPRLSAVNDRWFLVMFSTEEDSRFQSSSHKSPISSGHWSDKSERMHCVTSKGQTVCLFLGLDLLVETLPHQ